MTGENVLAQSSSPASWDGDSGCKGGVISGYGDVKLYIGMFLTIPGSGRKEMGATSF